MAERKLFRVHDQDFALYVIAQDWSDAIKRWKKFVADTTQEDEHEPEGIELVCDAEGIIV